MSRASPPLPRTSRVALAAIAFYRRRLARWFGGHCRFHPSCSCYGEQAFEQHGVWRAGWLTLRRVLRCHPWGGSGFDPVPPAIGSAAHDEPVRVDRALTMRADNHDKVEPSSDRMLFHPERLA